MKKAILAGLVVLTAIIGRAESGDSSPFLLDTADGTRIATAGTTERITYSPRWGNAAECTITIDGNRLLSTAEEGATTWTPQGVGGYTLTHTAGDLTYTAQFAVLGDDVAVHGGPIAASESWAAGKTHLVTAAVTVPSGISLTIASGAVVKFMPGTSLTIASGGSCTACGVVFTHVNDDTIGGDTLLDGDSAAPVMGGYAITGSITDDDDTEYRYMPPQALTSSISYDTRLRGHRCYVASNSVTVVSGATLTLQPGTIIKFAPGCSMTVNGTLDAQGTRAAPIVFTSIKDDEHGGDTNGDGDRTYAQPGDWYQIRVAGTANFNYCHVLYNSSTENYGGVEAYGGTVNFDNSEIAHTRYECVNAHSSGNFTARNSIFRDSSLGFGYYGSGRVKAYNCVFSDLTVAVRQSGKALTNCIFYRCLAFTDQSGDGSTYKNCVFYNPAGYGAQSYSKCGSNGNIWGDPMFVDAENDDFRIAANSPCINAGDAANAPEFDYYGQPRSGVPDIGIYEVQGDAGTGYDLAATAVNALAARSTIGETITVSYDVANVGRLAVTDPWHDALYLVSSASGKQYALGEPLNPGGLGAGETRTYTLQFALPVVPVGQYRLRLAVNSRRMDVPEGAATENNAIVSEGEIEVVADNVDAADGASGSVAAGASAVRAFTLPVGSGDRLMCITAAVGGTTLSARYALDFLPVAADGGTVLSFSGGAAWASVPAGTEKVWLVLDNNGGTVAASYKVEFLEGSLALSGVSPASIPSSGSVTVEIAGAGLTDDCEVSFTGAGTVAPISVKRVSQGLIAVTVDAAAFKSGSMYSVAVKKGAETKTLQDALSVSAAPGEPKFWAKLDVPSSMRQGRLVETCFIEYGNSGTADMLSPVLQVSMTGDGTLGYIGGLSGLKTLQFIAAGDAGSAGVLRPGSSHRIRFAIRAGASNKISLHTSEGSDYAPAPWTNAADYLADLSAAATRIEKLGGDSTDFALMSRYADYIRRDKVPNAVIGRLTDEFGQPMVGRFIEAENQDYTNVYSAVTSNNGVFSFEDLPNGRYRVRNTNAPFVGGDRMFEIIDSSDINDLGTVQVSAGGEIRIHITTPAARESVFLESLVDGSVYRPSGEELIFNGIPSGYYVAEWTCGDDVHVRQVFYYEVGEKKEVSLFRVRNNSVTVCCLNASHNEGSVAMLCNVDGMKILPFTDKDEVTFTDVENGQYTVVVRNETGDIFLVDAVSLESDSTEDLRVELSIDLKSTAFAHTAPKSNKTVLSVPIRNLSSSPYELSWWEKILYWSDDEFEDNLVAFMTHFGDIVDMRPDPPTGEYNCIHNYAKYEKRLTRYNVVVNEYRSTFMQRFYAYRAKQAFKGAKTAEWPIELSKTLAEKHLPFGWGTAVANFIEYGKRYSAGEVAFESYAEEFDKWAVDLMTKHYDDVLEMSKGVGPRARTAKKLIAEWGKSGKAVHYAGLATEILNYMILAIETGDAVAEYELAKEQLEAAWQRLETRINDFLQLENSWTGFEKCCGEEPQKKYDPPVDNKTPSVPKSWDPNEMVGEEGVGEARYVKPGQELTYTIYFENKAGFDIADAQEVKVTNPLSEWLDWSTFEMREVAFNNQCDVNLDRLANGTSEVQMNGTNKYVRTTVECDAGNGVVTWYMRVYDPHGDSEGYPLDGSGFLPSNDATHRGEGHLTYRIKVRDDAPGGKVINNSATIVFDYNEPIETDPAWWNTVAEVASVKITVDGAETTLNLIVGQPYGELPEPAARSGWTFGGWYTGPDGTGRRVTAQSLVENGDSALYEHWIKNAYTIKFNSNGGVGVMSNQAFKFDESKALDKNVFKKEGQVFIGWAIVSSGDVVYDDGEVVKNLAVENGAVVTLYAKWVSEKYTVKFDSNGGVGGWTKEMAFGEKIDMPVVTRDGYVFAGWQPAILATVPSRDVTFVAQWVNALPELWTETHDDVSDETASVPMGAASVYDGFIGTDGGELRGTIQVKVSKPKANKKTGETTAKVTASILMTGEKKVSVKGEMDASGGEFYGVAKDGRVLSLTLTAERMYGSFGVFHVKGSRNVFVSKDKGEQADANAGLAQWIGPVNVAWETADGWNGMTVTIANKGKAKAAGTLADGTKLSGTAQVVQGLEWSAVPVVITKKAALALTLWLSNEGQGSGAKDQRGVIVMGLGNDVVAGKPGTLASGSEFVMDVDAFAEMVGDDTFAEYLPNGVAVTQNGAKWSVPKGGKVVYKKGTMEVDEAKAGDNPSSLKLTYTAKTGAFKGSFKAYVNAKGKPKALAAKIVGVMVRGIAYGAATIKKLGSIGVGVR